MRSEKINLRKVGHADTSRNGKIALNTIMLFSERLNASLAHKWQKHLSRAKIMLFSTVFANFGRDNSNFIAVYIHHLVRHTLTDYIPNFYGWALKLSYPKPRKTLKKRLFLVKKSVFWNYTEITQSNRSETYLNRFSGQKHVRNDFVYATGVPSRKRPLHPGLVVLPW